MSDEDAMRVLPCGYVPTPADRAPVPATYETEPRHLGPSPDEQVRPFARFFTPAPRPIQTSAREALLAGPQPAELGYEISEAVARLSRPGYDAMETGWTRTERGTLVVNCLTSMPGVTAQMWDWWFGWHSTDSARYKLWHPGAHQFSAIGDDRRADRTLTDRQRYHNNVSYVDEYIGHRLNRLAIRFVDPTRLGFEDRPGVTHICARAGASDLPVAVSWLVHQVRPTEDGCEMRSRFFLGYPEILPLPPHSVTNPLAGRLLAGRLGRVAQPALDLATRPVTSLDYGRALLQHCATEMNHLAGFLPQLWSEFRDTP